MPLTAYALYAILKVMWKITETSTFREWFAELDVDALADIVEAAQVLKSYGPQLGRPHVDTVYESRHSNMKELRVQSTGRPFRIFFAFDPTRQAVFLIGGNKKGDKRFYKRMIAKSDDLYDEYLEDKNG